MADHAARWLPLGGALALCLLLYLPSVTAFAGQGDVAKFQLVGPALGTAHPTGYPLHTLLSHAAARLAPDRSWPEATNSLSALLTALTVAAVGAAARALGARPSVALAAALAFGAAPAVRGAAAVAEVYPLHLLLVAVVLGGLAAHASSGRGMPLVVATLATGAALAHHATAVCLLPAFAAALAGRPLPGSRVRRLATLGGALLLATLPYLYLVERSYAERVTYLESRAHSAAQLADVATGGPFKGHLARSGPAELLSHRVPWFAAQALSGGWWLLPAGLGGLYWARGAARRALVAFLVASALFLLLYDVPDLEAYLLAPFVALALAAAILVERLAEALARRLGRALPALAMPGLALLPLLASAPVEPSEAARAREVATLAALAGTPRGSALIVLGHDRGLTFELLRAQPPGSPGVGVLVVPEAALDAPFLLGPVARHLAGSAPLRLPPDDRALARGAPLFLADPDEALRGRLVALGFPLEPQAGSSLVRLAAPAAQPPPLAFVVEELEPAGPVDRALRRILEPSFDPTRTALVVGGETRRGSGGSVEAFASEPDRIRIEASVASGGGWLVVQETLRARWIVRVDGVEAPSFQVDYAYPAVELEAGRHVVELERDRRPFSWSRWLASPWGYLVP